MCAQQMRAVSVFVHLTLQFLCFLVLFFLSISLPDDLLRHVIFPFFTIHDICIIDVAMSSELDRLRLRNCSVAVTAIFEILKENTHIADLDISGCDR